MTLGLLSLVLPLSDELVGGEVAEGLVGANGVVGARPIPGTPLPCLQAYSRRRLRLARLSARSGEAIAA